MRRFLADHYDYFAGVAMTAVAIILALLLTGCPKGTQSLATASDTVAHALNDAQQATTLACTATPPIIDPATCAKINADFVGIATAGKTVDASIRANETTPTLAPKVNAFIDAFNQLNNKDLLGISNPNTRVALSTILVGAESAISTIAAFVGK